MARPHRRGHEALFAHEEEPLPAIAAEDATDEVTTEPTPESIEIPVFPCSSQLTKISSEWAIVRHTDIKTSAMFSLDRHQLIELGLSVRMIGQQVREPGLPLGCQGCLYRLHLYGSRRNELVSSGIQSPFDLRVRLAAPEQVGDLMTQVFPRIGHRRSDQRSARGLCQGGEGHRVHRVSFSSD